MFNRLAFGLFISAIGILIGIRGFDGSSLILLIALIVLIVLDASSDN